ncbi:hypothetical protein VKT23_005085 [Stygiomarasmius scandens]|uniref:Uncharacterized protein n=1 Tax=Marasmiellus scandens TaxID=2682957 RepID=A0ABR1JUY7_9AGAR
MFRSSSPYSPFFMSGLQPSEDFHRRGSLPTNSLHRTDSVRTRDVQDRSFLSLDLAESQSMKSVKHLGDGKASDSLKSPQQSPLRLRSSRDSLRTIPSPKPVPSVTLPEVPSPRLISITNTTHTFKFPLPPSSPSKAKPFIPSPAGPSTVPAIASPTAIVPQRSNSTATWKSSSTVSTRYKRSRRSDALARLEGRFPGTYKKRFSFASKKNFMNMLDDEDDGDDESGFGKDVESDDSFVDLPIDFSSSASPRVSLHGVYPDDDEDVVIPRSPAHRRLLSWGQTRSVRSRRSQSQSVSNYSPSSAYLKPKTSPSPPRRRRSRTVTMFPLTSFIDLKGEAGSKENDEEWGWRSFIEISSLS